MTQMFSKRQMLHNYGEIVKNRKSKFLNQSKSVPKIILYKQKEIKKKDQGVKKRSLSFQKQFDRKMSQ